MTKFEEITKSPEVLGAFLRSLPIIEGPWDEEFQRQFCSGCGKVSCDDGSRCPNEEKRDNPGWWLTLKTDAAGTCPDGCLKNYADPLPHCGTCDHRGGGSNRER